VEGLLFNIMLVKILASTSMEATV